MRFVPILLLALAACGDASGPHAPYGVGVQISSTFVPTGCVNDYFVFSSVSDPTLRLDWHVWFGTDEADYAGHARMGDTASASWHGSPRDLYRAHWQLGVGRERAGYGDPTSPNFGVMDYAWQSGDRAAAYRCGTTWRGQ